MNSNAESLLRSLEDEMDKKCFELREIKREKQMRNVFIWACAGFVAVPFLLSLAGIRPLTLYIPAAAVLIFSFLLLSPFISGGRSGGYAK